MASKSTPDLMRAIEGFSTEHSGSQEHEPAIAMLARVKGEIERGKGNNTAMSPGKREARNAAETRMTGEENHTGGEGNKTTNAPGSAGGPDRAPDIHTESSGEENMTGTGPIPSRGNLVSNLAGPPARSGVVEMRRMAAAKGLESGSTSGGNRRSNPPGKADSNEARIGDVKAPAKAPADKNTEGDGFEGKPPFSGEQLRGDGWTKAREKARTLAPAAR